MLVVVLVKGSEKRRRQVRLFIRALDERTKEMTRSDCLLETCTVQRLKEETAT